MPVLNMETFNSLPGDKSQNFEDLCRGLMRLHYGRAGSFKALANQPGVEFHLQLKDTCALGDPPRWFGWQCKYHQRTQADNLRASSKNKIESSLRTTEKHLPNITDWILWTPYTLSKNDQAWFDELSKTTDMNLGLWNAKELDMYLSGEGLMLRNTYFGELILTPTNLESQHKVSIKPIQNRWMEPVHQIVDVEKITRRMLGEPEAWEHLHSLGESLENTSIIILREQIPEIKKIVELFTTICNDFAVILLNFHNILAEGNLDVIYHGLEEQKSLISPQVRAVPRQLRSRNLPIAIDATNALDDMLLAQELLGVAEDYLKVEMVAIMADAGGGKTQLAAQLSAPQMNRPAGILLYGRYLHRGQDLNGLASHISINGNPVPGIEPLIGALDGAAKRAKCRLPIVIDGLNEAEDPREWKPLLAQLGEIARQYPNVLVVCTLRTGERRRYDRFGEAANHVDTREIFAKGALPDNTRIIESDGFGLGVDNAIEKYFSYYKINPGDTEVPRGLFSHPLTLRIFCEAKNPERENEVKIDYFPAALTPLFDEYISAACKRISEYPNRSYYYSADTIRSAIYKLGIDFWKSKKREVSESVYRDSLSDTDLQWDHWDSNVINLLTQEGIVFRNLGNEPGQYYISPAFDTLGGFIIADSLLTKHDGDHNFKWLQKQDALDAFRGSDTHELANDIFKSLVTLTPRFHKTQLWKEIGEPLRRIALFFSLDVEPDYLDEETIGALRELLIDNGVAGSGLFANLNKIRGVVEHPLNSLFIDSVLCEMTIAERDLGWSEWIRKIGAGIYNDLLSLELRWKDDLNIRTDSDRLHAIWVMWLLTSTDRGLRDVATRVLYWFGRGYPESLFDLAINSLTINDPYVPERMLAASYGVSMAYYSGLDKQSFVNTSLAGYANQLYEALFAKGASFNTTHLLLREYAMRTIELAVLHNPDLLNANEIERCKPPFTDGKLDCWGESDIYKDEYLGGNSPFRMDFDNYTIGSLVPGRRNYDSEHAGFKKVRSQILWRVEQLGWSKDRFGSIDRELEDSRYRSWEDRPETRIDRYGKKYSWIAYYEMSGVLHDQGSIENWRERTSSADIDPSFPDRVTYGNVIKLSLLDTPETETQDWITNGSVPDLDPYLQIRSVNQEEGPWVLLDGFITQENKDLRRDSFCFTRSFLVDKQQAEIFVEHLTKDKFIRSELQHTPSVIYTFAGEIPWCDAYPKNDIIEFAIAEGEKIMVCIPVCDFGWEGYQSITNDSGHAATLAKEISSYLDLVGLPQTFDLYTNNGTRATLNISDKTDKFNNYQSLFFMRKDLLNTYLDNHGLALVWVVWGERRSISNRFLKQTQATPKPDPPYKTFHYAKLFT